MKIISVCCKVDVDIFKKDDTSSLYFECPKCGKECDIIDELGEHQTKRGILFSKIGSKKLLSSSDYEITQDIL